MYKMLPLAMNYDFSLYFDYAATTPLLPAVAEKIASFNKQAMFFMIKINQIESKNKLGPRQIG